MQEDMHYYGTLAVASAAGLSEKDAEIVAYSSQFVDDSTGRSSEENRDGGLLFGEASAHHPRECAVNACLDRPEQRRVWIPFHFLPGGEGSTLEEKLICTKDSDIANEMFEDHISFAVSRYGEYGLHLLGIAAHTYMDTFSHYGFSGISSEYNGIDPDSVDVTPNSERIRDYVERKMASFKDKFVQAIGIGAELGSDCLGHGGVATCPDRPYLNWSFRFLKARPGNGTESSRQNAGVYLEACSDLYDHFREFASKAYSEDNSVPFSDIRSKIDSMVTFEGTKEQRIEQWMKSGLLSGNVHKYDARIWERDKDRFSEYETSSMGINRNVYRFHQAVTYHRGYVLKDLLPRRGIAVY